MKKLPIGISTLSSMRENNYLYIDKTHHIQQLTNNGAYYFLSKPRRFGKSLLIDTIKQAFLGNKHLFQGLYLEKNWNWNEKHPVIHLSFGGGSSILSEENLCDFLQTSLTSYAKSYDISFDSKTISNQFRELISKIYQKTKTRVVVLIDEYDKPILDVINNPSDATTNREILRGFYGTMKSLDEELCFVLLTGVSKFSKVSLFSDLNNLDDISLDPRYADICGYTQSEMESAFSEYLKEGNVDLVKLKTWYNGYNFAGLPEQKVYNPFDLLLFCSKNYQYKSYWFETATPSFLIKIIKQNNYYFPNFENEKVSAESLASFDVDNIPLTTLLFQTGYLTINNVISTYGQYGYQLTFPNLEVKSSLNSHLMELGTSTTQKNQTLYGLLECIAEEKFDDIKTRLNSHFASIPHDWYRKNKISQSEGFYASIVYSCFAALGVEMQAEDTTNIGKIDLTLKAPDKILIIEFKLAKYGSATDALNQIKAKKYADKFKLDKRPIFLIGMSFDVNNRMVNELIWQKY